MHHDAPARGRRRAVTMAVAVTLVVGLGLVRVASFTPPGWVLAVAQATVALAAAAGATALVVDGLRRGRDASHLGGGAAVLLAAGFAATAAGEPVAAPAASIAAVAWLGSAVAGRLDRRRLRRGPGLRLAAGAFGVSGVIVISLILMPDAGRLIAAALFGLAAVAFAAAGTQTAHRTPAPISATLLLALGCAILALASPSSAEPLLGHAALLAGMAATAQSAVARARAELPVMAGDRSPQRRLPRLAEGVSDATLFFDGQLRLRDWNPAATALLSIGEAERGMQLEDLLGISLAAIQRADDGLLVPGFAGREPMIARLASYGDGLVVVARPEVVQGSAEAVERMGRELRGTIEELMQARRTIELQRHELERAATIDSLTGLASRAQILERLRVEVAQARRYAHPVALALVDVDGMAKLNHLHGVAAGDAVLREVALRTRLRVRDADAMGRSSGDAFLAILPHTDETGAATFADALRARLAQRPMLVGDATMPVTVSIGVAVMRPGEELDADGLLARTEEALASAQARGGNAIALDRLHGLARLEPRRADPETAADGDEAARQLGR